ncbi:hypothetical protein NR798_29290 [Archangium gephyra]|uniref:hypothetical protein n=1 Tax=Archangium gephyra TaxID=48 RepID=UPI0035D4340A
MSADIRRQLEGGIETLEAAHARYTFLEKALRHKHWQHAVMARLETLREQVRQEPALLESLARLLQRARVEGWTDTEPALVLARKVEELRTRMEALTRERLGPPMDREAPAEGITRLHQVLARTMALPVSSEEQALHQGGFEADAMAPLLPFLLMLGPIVALGFKITLSPTILWCLLLVASTLLMTFIPSLWDLLERLRSGRFWFTPERLVWQPMGRDPLHIPLQAIPPDGVRLLSTRSVEVRLVDGRTVRLGFIQGAEKLVTLLEQYRKVPMGPRSTGVHPASATTTAVASPTSKETHSWPRSP